MPSDWWLNQVIRDLKLEIYWMEPTIVTQGTPKQENINLHINFEIYKIYFLLSK